MKVYVFKLRNIIKLLLVLTLVVVLAAAAFTIGPKAVGVFNAQRELPIYSVEVPDKTAAITFDCAWGADDISVILETLKNEGIKATFFIVGQWAEKFPEAVKQIAAGGHDVANHSWSHPKMASLDRSSIETELSRCTKKLEDLTGKKTNLFRPPYGDYNNTVVKTAQDLGYYTIQWDVDSLDWKPGITPDRIVERINQKIKIGSIILFHNDTEHTAKVLPDIIRELKTAGYKFAPVSELIIKEDYFIDFDGRQKKK